MAHAKQTLTLIFLYSHIIISTYTNAHSSPFHAPAGGPTEPEDDENDLNPSDFPLPDVNTPPPKPPDKPDKPDKKKKPDKSDKKKKPDKPDDDPDDEPEDEPDDSTGGSEAVVAKKVAKKMQCVEKKIDEFNASLKKRLECPESSPGAKECVSECDEVLGAALDDIQKTLESLDSGFLMKANFDVSAVSTNVDTCNDCFKEMVGGDPEVEKFGEWVRKMTEEALEDIPISE